MKIRNLVLCLLLLSLMSALFGSSDKEPVFTTDYFSRKMPTWKPYLKEFHDQPNQSCLEIGSWEGRSSLYIAENFCNGEGSHLDCVDTWEGSREHKHKKNLSTLYERFLANTKSYRNSKKIIPYRGKSKDVLQDLNNKLRIGAIRKYNFIYIDGSHDAKDVLVDAVLAWELLKLGGIMIFDDYEYLKGDHLSPKPAIEGFLKSYKTMYKILHKGYQLHIRKISEEPSNINSKSKNKRKN